MIIDGYLIFPDFHKNKFCFVIGILIQHITFASRLCIGAVDQGRAATMKSDTFSGLIKTRAVIIFFVTESASGAIAITSAGAGFFGAQAMIKIDSTTKGTNNLVFIG